MKVEVDVTPETYAAIIGDLRGAKGSFNEHTGIFLEQVFVETDKVAEKLYDQSRAILEIAEKKQ